MSEVEKREEFHPKSERRDVYSAEFEIVNKLGLHARAAVLFIKAASRFASKITIIKDDLEVNGKSIMGILMLGAPLGSRITVVAEGPDAQKAISELGKLIASKFGEE